MALERDLRSAVTVVVVNWNGARHVTDCIDSAVGQSHPRVSVVVIDNGSTDGSLEAIRSRYEGLTVVENGANLGYCRALNQGINLKDSEFVLCLNSDVRLEADYVERAVETLSGLPECGMLSGKILRFDGKTLDSTGQFVGRDRRPRERGYGVRDNGQYERRDFVFSVCGAVAFYRRKMLDQLALRGQYFDESYFAFNEDLDLGWRGQLQGWKCVYEPRAVAYHERGGTGSPVKTGSLMLKKKQLLKRPALIRYHIIKNRYLTVLKNDSLESLLADMPVILAFDAAMWSLVALTSPLLIPLAPRMARETLSALPKRREVQSRRTVGYDSIRSGIV